jgi:hypothetical protein
METFINRPQSYSDRRLIMALQFSDPTFRHAYAREQVDGNSFYGKNKDKMPELLQDNRTPLSAAGLMKLRLRALDLYSNVIENPNNFTPQYRKEVAQFFKDVWSNYADTGDAVLYHPNGNFKTDLDSVALRTINEKTELTGDGAVSLKSGLYSAAQMPKFTQSDRDKYTGSAQNEADTNNNRLWRVFARHPDEVPKELAENPALLRSYAKAVNHLAKLAFGYNQNMGIYLTDAPKQEEMRSWLVWWLEDRSGAIGWGHLDDDGGRVVGVAPEAPRLEVVPAERLEEILKKLKPHKAEVKQLLTA